MKLSEEKFIMLIHANQVAIEALGKEIQEIKNRLMKLESEMLEGDKSGDKNRFNFVKKSIALRNKFQEQIKDRLWKNVFWSGSYCLITTGQVTLDQVKKYVESQGE